MPAKIQIKRIYEEPVESDGYRILADRLWPRGVAKADAHIDLWAKELAPSTELRKWFHAETRDYQEFSRRYRSELESNLTEIQGIIKKIEVSKFTLLTAVKDVEHSHVPILKKFLVKQLS
ncbi:DUF488 domain-containing protein [Gimesia algae]|uniref:Uroporphyrin-III C-methyltransferase n=1 Tax=Gimesia algae TaxID=2527971 RepID=A0A517VHZ5_9PLAN|nr:DUF488 family protein [Gimesia algae]QDT92644.1 hypothetical protein Pan161_43120 [Gimesia algae]